MLTWCFRLFILIIMKASLIRRPYFLKKYSKLMHIGTKTWYKNDISHRLWGRNMKIKKKPMEFIHFINCVLLPRITSANFSSKISWDAIWSERAQFNKRKKKPKSKPMTISKIFSQNSLNKNEHTKKIRWMIWIFHLSVLQECSMLVYSVLTAYELGY